MPSSHILRNVSYYYTLWIYILLGYSPVRWMDVYASGDSVGSVGVCTEPCACQWSHGKPKVDCSAKNLTTPPQNLSVTTTHL